MKKVLSLLVLLSAMFVSCTPEPSLQKYFVEKAESKDFVAIDIAPTFINTDSLELSKDEARALNSLHKFNILAFTNTANEAEYEQEKGKVKELLKGEEYDELMKFGSPERGASIHSIGEGEHIEEFVLFVHGRENGFGVVRVLGDDMTPENVLTLVSVLQKANINMEQLKPLEGLVKNKM